MWSWGTRQERRPGSTWAARHSRRSFSCWELHHDPLGEEMEELWEKTRNRVSRPPAVGGITSPLLPRERGRWPCRAPRGSKGPRRLLHSSNTNRCCSFTDINRTPPFKNSTNGVSRISFREFLVYLNNSLLDSWFHKHKQGLRLGLSTAWPKSG